MNSLTFIFEDYDHKLHKTNLFIHNFFLQFLLYFKWFNEGLYSFYQICCDTTKKFEKRFLRLFFTCLSVTGIERNNAF